MVPFLRSNLVWMILSLVLSTGLWVFVTFKEDPEVTHTISAIPVVVQDAPKTMVVQSETSTVQAIVSAPSDVWPQLQPDKIRAVIDASKVTPGLQELPVKLTSTDPRARITGVEPPTVFLKVEPLETKSVPVKVDLSGTVSFGYENGTYKTTPNAVVVSGPQSAVSQVASVLVTVNLDGVTQSIDKTYQPVVVTATGKTVDQVTVDPAAVLVDVPVEQKISYKTLPVQPTLAGNVALGYQIVGVMVDPQTVTLVGDPIALNQMSFVPTQPINVNNATGDQAVNADLELPKTVALARSQTVVVRVLISTINGSKTIQVSPQITGGAPNVNYGINPGSVNVTLEGPIPVLSRVQPSDMTVTANAGGTTTGTQSVRVQVTAPPLLKITSVQPQNVNLTAK